MEPRLSRALTASSRFNATAKPQAQHMVPEDSKGHSLMRPRDISCDLSHISQVGPMHRLFQVILVVVLSAMVSTQDTEVFPLGSKPMSFFSHLYECQQCKPVPPLTRPGRNIFFNLAMQNDRFVQGTGEFRRSSVTSNGTDRIGHRPRARPSDTRCSV